MKKLVRDARAFEKRALMGKFKLWLIVEGRTHDRSFYDELLNKYAGVANDEYEIRLAEDFKLDGRSAGGKTFALQLFDHWESSGGLVQNDKDRRKSAIVMALDHDYDTLAGSARSSRHIIYTSGMDVESEILRSTDLHRAIRSTYSLPMATVAKIVVDAQSAFQELGRIYRTWITLGVIAAKCGYRGSSRFAQLSTINEGGFGELNARAEGQVVSEVLDAAVNRHDEDWIEDIEGAIAAIYATGSEWRLVKGRWFAKYISYLVSTTAPEVVEGGIPPATLAKTAMAYLDSNADCFQHYFKRLDLVLN